MKVRLAAEEYSRHASLCARTPTRCADLLRRRLRVPLASCVGNRPRYSVRLRGHALHPGLAGPGSSGPCNGHARADTRGCGKPRSSGSNRECRSLGGRDRTAELENLPPCDFVSGGCQGPRRRRAPRRLRRPLHRRPVLRRLLHRRPVLLRRPRRRRVRRRSSRHRLTRGSVPDGEKAIATTFTLALPPRLRRLRRNPSLHSRRPPPSSRRTTATRRRNSRG